MLIAYEPANAVDLQGGYVANGKLIETTGHLWLKAELALFNVGRISARARYRSIYSKLGPQAMQRLIGECSAKSQFKRFPCLLRGC
jgi:hypothetical protein